ncbi:MAG: ribosome hibernation-promoting factor, HPF/YfiA family [Blastocatellia bacterium]
MQLEFTGRNFTLTPAIRRHANDHFEKITTVLGSAFKAHIILSVEKHHRHVAEIVVTWHDHALTGKADSTDMYASLSQAIEKLKRQLLKVKGKLIYNKQHATTASEAPFVTEAPARPEKRAPRIIRSRGNQAKPMTPDEARLNLESNGEQFVVFRDAGSNRVGVMYKRKDGNFGLIEP